LLEALVAVRAASVLGPGRAPRVIAAAEVVLEGQAVSAPDPGWVVVHRAGRGTSGDDVLVEAAERLVADGNEVIAVSADRGLRDRWVSLAGPRMADPGMAGSVHSVGPRWLLDVLDGTTLPGPGSPSGSMRP
jgi:hypothetical protein